MSMYDVHMPATEPRDEGRGGEGRGVDDFVCFEDCSAVDRTHLPKKRILGRHWRHAVGHAMS